MRTPTTTTASAFVVPRLTECALLNTNHDTSAANTSPEYDVHISERTLRQLRVFDGDYVLCSVRMLSEDGETLSPLDRTVPARVVRVLLLQPGEVGTRLAHDTAYINPLLEFILGMHSGNEGDASSSSVPHHCTRGLYLTATSARILGPNHAASRPDHAGKDDNKANHNGDNGAIVSKEVCFETATHATIARVRTVESEGRTSYADALMQYFKEPRIVVEGDIFAVLHSGQQESREQPHEDEKGEGQDGRDGSEKHDRQQEATDDPETLVADPFRQPKMIFFKVTRLKKAGRRLEDLCAVDMGLRHMVNTGVIDCASTQLVQEGAISSFLPAYLPLRQMLCLSSSSTTTTTHASSYRFFCNNPLSQPIDDAVQRQLFHLAKPCFLSPSRSILSNLVLLCGPRGSGKCAIVESVASALGVGALTINYRLDVAAGSNMDVASATTCTRIDEYVDKALDSAPCILHIRRFRARPIVEGQSQNYDGVVAVAHALERVANRCAMAASSGERANVVLIVLSAEHQDDLDESVRRKLSHEIQITGVGEAARKTQMARLPMGNGHGGSGDSGGGKIGDSVMRRTSGRSWVELQAVMAQSGQSALGRMGVLACPIGQRGGVAPRLLPDAPSSSYSSTSSSSQHALPGQSFVVTASDLEHAVSSFSPPGQSTAGTVQVPNVKWDDVGGLGHAKQEIMDMINLPLQHPELFGAGMKQRSGILLYGPPGTGKTLMAKAVATECGLNFLSVKGPELLNMYIGESEKNVREVFERARNARPCVIFFDELDSLAPARGRGSDGGGVMDRVVSQLLTEIDGLSSSEGGGGGDVEGGSKDAKAGGNDLFVIGATNRPDLLDSSLLRPGRFDRLIYLGIASDRESQGKIIRALTRKFALGVDATVDRIADLCPDNFTGADFYALCSNALASAIKRRALEIQSEVQSLQETDIYSEKQITIQGWLAEDSPPELAVRVSFEDFQTAIKGIVPSVSRADLRKYEALREQFSAGAPRGTEKRP
jgi:SpoVK/Ycf46/Vps4 family AAA+-type ATPase